MRKDAVVACLQIYQPSPWETKENHEITLHDSWRPRRVSNQVLLEHRPEALINLVGMYQCLEGTQGGSVS
jgi:hypothetical protein